MRRLLIAASVLGMFAVAAEASAQQSVYTRTQLNGWRLRNTASGYNSQRIRRNVYQQAVPQYAFNTLNRNMFQSALTGRPLQKPFSGGAGGGRGVTPYLGLSAPFSSTAEQYYTQVRPQLQQQRINQQMAARNAQMQRQLNAIAAQPPYALQGTEDMVPTGHVAAFMNYGGYYPQTDSRR